VTVRYRAKAGWAALAIVVSAGFAGDAQAQSRCGASGQATAASTITYDPFSATGLSQVTIPLILTRTRGNVVGYTRDVSIILTQPVGSPAYQVTYNGYNVLYSEGATQSRPRATTSQDSGTNAAGEIRYTWGGLLASDVSTPLNLRVTVPPNADLSAGDPIEFDILFVCTGVVLDNVGTPTRLADGIRINVNTVSALQAYYAGSALNFGEVGDLTTAQVTSAPASYTTPLSNTIRVKSSGPYEVRVQSQNDFKLTFPGGALGDASQTIRYQARFLGTNVTSNSSFGTRTCQRAGVSGSGGTLPITATLLEGGAGKAPSDNYADTITVTFSPVVTASAALSCAAL
jgi:hypothetical protein